MKKTKRKRLELEREVVKVLAAIPAAGLKYVPGGETGGHESGGRDSGCDSGSLCSDRSCLLSGCLPW